MQHVYILGDLGLGDQNRKNKSQQGSRSGRRHLATKALHLAPPSAEEMRPGFLCIFPTVDETKPLYDLIQEIMVAHTIKRVAMISRTSGMGSCHHSLHLILVGRVYSMGPVVSRLYEGGVQPDSGKGEGQDQEKREEQPGPRPTTP